MELQFSRIGVFTAADGSLTKQPNNVFVPFSLRMYPNAIPRLGLSKSKDIGGVPEYPLVIILPLKLLQVGASPVFQQTRLSRV